MHIICVGCRTTLTRGREIVTCEGKCHHAIRKTAELSHEVSFVEKTHSEHALCNKCSTMQATRCHCHAYEYRKEFAECPKYSPYYGTYYEYHFITKNSAFFVLLYLTGAQSALGCRVSEIVCSPIAVLCVLSIVHANTLWK